MPREGIERIILKLRGGEKQLSRHVVPGWQLGETETFTQRLFVASSGGRYLAWSDAKKGSLRVLGGKRERVIEKVFGRDARFSPDERLLAAVRTGAKGDNEVVVLDLASGQVDTLGQIGAPQWMEWVKGGVVVSYQIGSMNTISYLPLDGSKPVEVASGTTSDLAARFTTARLGHRAMYFFQKRAFVVDVESPAADAREVGTLPREVDNAEMSPDGSQAAMVVAGSGVYRWREGEELVQVGTDAAHTVWYSADGKLLAYASLDKAVVVDGEKRHEIESPEYGLNAMRFHGESLVVSMDKKALLWNPKTGSKKVLGTAGKGKTVQAADIYKGGVVLWTREIRRTDRRRAQKNRAANPFAMAD